jgi:hypothetical protein
MEYRINGHVGGTNIITPKSWGRGGPNTKFLKECLDP